MTAWSRSCTRAWTSWSSRAWSGARHRLRKVPYPIRLFRRAAADDLDRLVEREVGRDHADAAIVREPPGLAVDVARISVDPVGEGQRRPRRSSIVCRLSRKSGIVDEAAAELVHDIRRVAVSRCSDRA